MPSAKRHGRHRSGKDDKKKDKKKKQKGPLPSHKRPKKRLPLPVAQPGPRGSASERKRILRKQMEYEFNLDQQDQQHHGSGGGDEAARRRRRRTEHKKPSPQSVAAAAPSVLRPFPPRPPAAPSRQAPPPPSSSHAKQPRARKSQQHEHRVVSDVFIIGAGTAATPAPARAVSPICELLSSSDSDDGAGVVPKSASQEASSLQQKQQHQMPMPASPTPGSSSLLPVAALVVRLSADGTSIMGVASPSHQAHVVDATSIDVNFVGYVDPAALPAVRAMPLNVTSDATDAPNVRAARLANATVRLSFDGPVAYLRNVLLLVSLCRAAPPPATPASAQSIVGDAVAAID